MSPVSVGSPVLKWTFLIVQLRFPVCGYDCWTLITKSWNDGGAHYLGRKQIITSLRLKLLILPYGREVILDPDLKCYLWCFQFISSWLERNATNDEWHGKGHCYASLVVWHTCPPQVPSSFQHIFELGIQLCLPLCSPLEQLFFNNMYEM